MLYCVSISLFHRQILVSLRTFAPQPSSTIDEDPLLSTRCALVTQSGRDSSDYYRMSHFAIWRYTYNFSSRRHTDYKFLLFLQICALSRYLFSSSACTIYCMYLRCWLLHDCNATRSLHVSFKHLSSDSIQRSSAVPLVFLTLCIHILPNTSESPVLLYSIDSTSLDLHSYTLMLNNTSERNLLLVHILHANILWFTFRLNLLCFKVEEEK